MRLYNPLSRRTLMKAGATCISSTVMGSTFAHALSAYINETKTCSVFKLVE